MKERPILFSAPMVRALLDGSKTQTRRVVKLRSSKLIYDLSGAWVDGAPNSQYLHVPFRHKDDAPGDSCSTRESCPYGAVGDQLWVRETFGLYGDQEKHVLHYRATHYRDGDDMGWKPSIHMPRWASRITLEIAGVRVEQLGQISRDDAISEGVGSVEEYVELWKLINGRDSWNPKTWVWIVEFQRVSNCEAFQG